MGKRGKKAVGQKRGEAGTGRPSPWLVIALVVVGVAVVLQQMGVFRPQAPDRARPTPRASGASGNELWEGQFQKVMKAHQGHEVLPASDYSWLMSEAESMCSPMTSSQHSVIHTVSLLELASFFAREAGDRGRAQRFNTQVARSLPNVSPASARKSLVTSILGRIWDEKQIIPQGALGVVDEVIAAGKAANDPYLVEEGSHIKSRSLVRSGGDLSAAVEAIQDCIEWGRREGFHTQKCIGYELLLLSWQGDFAQSFEHMHANYEYLLETFRPFGVERGDACELHLLSSEGMSNDVVTELPHMTVHTEAKALDSLLEVSRPLVCTEQDWPLVMLTGDLSTGGDFQPYSQGSNDDQPFWSVYEWTEPVFQRLECLDASKELRLLEFRDVYIHGPMQTISSSDPCSILHKGYPYTYITVADDKFHSLPIVEVDRVSMLSHLQKNYFHFLIEETQQILLPQLFDVLDGEVVPLILHPHELLAKILPHVQHLGRGVDLLIPYSSAKVFHVNHLFMTDYEYVDGKPAGAHSAEEYFLPSLAVLQAVRHLLTDHLSLPSTVPHERTVLLVKRSPGSPRSVQNFESLRNSLSRVARQRGITLQVFSETTTIEEAVLAFHKAVVVVGAHGAGLANTVFCQAGSAVVEIPAFPPKPPMYGMMAKTLSLEFWRISTAMADFNSPFHMEDISLQQVAFTVDHILQTRGYDRALVD